MTETIIKAQFMGVFPKNVTYRVNLGAGALYRYIGFYKWHLYLKNTNKRLAICYVCNRQIAPTFGVQQGVKGYTNRYMHIDCAKRKIVEFASAGYRENIIFNLQTTDAPSQVQYTAQQVCDGITRYTYETNLQGIDILKPWE